jgi:hypothetical protein
MSFTKELFDRDWKSPSVLFEEEFDAHPNRNLVLRVMEVARSQTQPVNQSRLSGVDAKASLAMRWLAMNKHWAPWWAVTACTRLLAYPESSYLLSLHPDVVATLAGSGNKDAKQMLEAVRILYQGDDDAKPNR